MIRRCWSRWVCRRDGARAWRRFTACTSAWTWRHTRPALGAWLAQTEPPSEPLQPSVKQVREGIAIDGKVLRGSQPRRAGESDSVPGTSLVAAYAHRSGLVVGQARAAGKGHELAAATALLKQVPIAGRVITADARLTQRDLSEQIVTDRGDHLFPIDENQPALFADAEAALSPLDGRRAPAHRPADGRDDATPLAPA
jgi:hypothetical protein